MNDGYQREGSVMSIRVPAAVLLAAAVLAGCASTGGDRPEAPPPLSGEEVRLNVESFEYAWGRIDETLWEEVKDTVSWDSVRTALLPRVEEARTMREARAVMEEMVGSVGLSHYQIIPAYAYEDYGAGDGGGSGGETGLTVRLIGGRPLVLSVREGSPADSAGISPGWEVVSIGGERTAERLARLQDYFAGHLLRDVIIGGAVQGRLTGAPGDTLPLTFETGSGEAVERPVVLERPRGNAYTLGFLPEVHVWIDTMTVAGDIGYVAWNMFMDIPNVMPLYNSAIASFMDRRGIILDLRGNLGGIAAMASGMAGWFVREKGVFFGTFIMKGVRLKLVVNPRPGGFEGPVAVLVDGQSMSSAEFFAGGLQANGRARVFGVRTPGVALPSVIEKLPNGDALQYVHADYINADGERLEGKGVIPDHRVEPTREELLAGRDPVLEAAIEWIEREKGTGRQE